jgi:hypothetical protein
MVYYIKVEDRNGVIRSYMRFDTKDTAYKVYQLIVEECMQKEDRVKLMDSDFSVLKSFSTRQPNLRDNHMDSL